MLLFGLPWGQTDVVAHCDRAIPGAAQNLVTSLKWKLVAFIAGTTISIDSSPDARSGCDSCSTLHSRSSRLSLKRKLRTPQTTRILNAIKAGAKSAKDVQAQTRIPLEAAGESFVQTVASLCAKDVEPGP